MSCTSAHYGKLCEGVWIKFLHWDRVVAFRTYGRACRPICLIPIIAGALKLKRIFQLFADAAVTMVVDVWLPASVHAQMVLPVPGVRDPYVIRLVKTTENVCIPASVNVNEATMGCTVNNVNTDFFPYLIKKKNTYNVTCNYRSTIGIFITIELVFVCSKIHEPSFYFAWLNWTHNWLCHSLAFGWNR